MPAIQQQIVIVGGGHNGLVSAAYLAKLGYAVTVCESRETLGGVAGSFEYFPGYRSSITNSPGSFEGRVLQELELERHGLRFAKPELTLTHPFGDSVFLGWRDPALVNAQLDRFASGEADRYRTLIQSLNRLGLASGLSLWKTPPEAAQVRASLNDPEDARLWDRLLYESLTELVADLRSSQARALLMMIAVNGQLVSPDEPGSGLGLLMRPISMASAQEKNPFDAHDLPLRGSVGLPIGSMGALVDALVRAGRTAGANYRTGARVEQILFGDQQACGVRLATGEVLAADHVISAIEPSLLTGFLLGESFSASQIAERPKPTGSAAKIAVQLDGLPEYRVPGDADHPLVHPFASQIRIGPSPEYISRSIAQGLAGEASEEPIMWALTPSVTSPGLAPEGRHLLSINAWHAPHSLGAEYWAQNAENFGRRCLNVLDSFFPGLQNRVIGMRVLGPTDLEAEFSLTGSNITHGDMLPHLMFGSSRPDHVLTEEGQIPGLTLGGAGTWPGGYVTGAPGRNAAMTAHKTLRPLVAR